MRTLRRAALTLLLVACSKETSPVGPVGSPIDLRSHLKPDVVTRAPSDAQAKEANVALDVHGVRARLTWRHFEDGPNKYLLSAQWIVDAPVSGVSLESTGARGMPVNAGTPDAVNQEMLIGVRWEDHTKPGAKSSGDMTVRIRADGGGQQM